MHSIALRLPEELEKEVNKISHELERSKSYIIRKAIQAFVTEYFDYQIALDRLNDKDDEIISSKKMRLLLGKKD
ncbi:MAG: ribbon-helix-helix protein, CopG family [Elusimicrobia bacterium]|nr:ribbon-helix-helix protein, CopG family [Elusimicrobiota bacterium]MBU2613984.1 ribbon-helix-helix protein, CopG family [Elusimicrobiota bacterium]